MLHPFAEVISEGSPSTKKAKSSILDRRKALKNLGFKIGGLFAFSSVAKAASDSVYPTIPTTPTTMALGEEGGDGFEFEVCNVDLEKKI